MSKRVRVSSPPLYFNHHDLVEALASHTGYVLTYVAQMAQIALDESLEPLDIDSRQLGVLVLIAETEYRSQVAISEHMGLDRAHVARLVDDLEKLGYVSRDADLNDRRYYNLTLTLAGQDALQNAKRRSQETEDDVFQTLSDAERTTFHTLLKKVAEHRFSLKKTE